MAPALTGARGFQRIRKLKKDTLDTTSQRLTGGAFQYNVLYRNRCKISFMY